MTYTITKSKLIVGAAGSLAIGILIGALGSHFLSPQEYVVNGELMTKQQMIEAKKSDDEYMKRFMGTK
ncbi:MAG: hypothetical protein H2069_10150 [Legionella sp.]|nr:hypothetical protein [Legionella sp.]